MKYYKRDSDKGKKSIVFDLASCFVCSHVITQRGTNKKSVVNVYVEFLLLKIAT